MQLVWPAALYVPFAQSMLAVPDVLGHAEPAGHVVQAVADPTANVPARQAIGDADVEGQRNPAGQ